MSDRSPSQAQSRRCHEYVPPGGACLYCINDLRTPGHVKVADNELYKSKDETVNNRRPLHATRITCPSFRPEDRPLHQMMRLGLDALRRGKPREQKTESRSRQRKVVKGQATRRKNMLAHTVFQQIITGNFTLCSSSVGRSRFASTASANRSSRHCCIRSRLLRGSSPTKRLSHA